MITKETTVRIVRAYREIEAAKQFLENIEKAIAKWDDWGDPRHVERDNSLRFAEMSVPMHGVTEGTIHLYAVKPRLALSVIRAHIADQERELVEANEQARIELETA